MFSQVEGNGRFDRSTRTLTFSGLSLLSDDVFLDGAHYVENGDTDITDIAHVQVLKGTQSVYFGRNTFSGAVNYVTNDPSDHFEVRLFFFFNATATTEIYTLSLHDALPICAQPGDLIFADTNNDGAITDDDKVMIGDPNPDFQANLSLNFGYKGFDFSITTVGKFGHQIAKSYRSFADSPLQNYTTDIFERWHGEGTSNR